MVLAGETPDAAAEVGVAAGESPRESAVGRDGGGGVVGAQSNPSRPWTGVCDERGEGSSTERELSMAD